MDGMSKYRLFSVNYCQFVTLSLLQAAIVLWTVVVMPEGVLVPPLPHPLITLA
jgi:hypothetical protein